VHIIRTAVVLGIASVLVTGCGSGGQQTVVTVTATATETTQAPAPASSSPEPVASAPSEAATPQSTPSTIKVPDGVGMNYQDAQDMWRAAGLIVLPATDATGANRIPVLDSNWFVVAQDLKPGSKVPVDTGITATVKKYTDG
jgi:hypothetical protein